MNPSDQMQLLITGFRVSQAVHTAAELRLSDVLADQPMTVGDLANAAACDPGALHRLLRALASLGVYEELPDGRFASTALGDQLRSDVPGSQHAFATFVGRPYWWQAWSALSYSIRTGRNAFQFVHGRDDWQYRAEHPEESATFDRELGAVGIARIDMYAPTTPDERLARLVPASRGFVYCVSLTGVTGARRALGPDVAAFVARVRRHTALPIVLGFGISEPAHVSALRGLVDGVAIGSAAIDAVTAASDKPAALRGFVRGLVEAGRS